MSLTFFGDTILDKPYTIELDFEHFIFNLETPLSCDGIPALNKVNICQKESHIQATFGKVPLAVSMANNHVMDFGEEAFAKTKTSLEKQNIPYFGAGLKGENFNNPQIIKFGDKTVGLCGYCCPSAHPTFGDELNNGSAYLDPKEVLKDIKTLQDKKVDMIIIQPHWGIQEIPFPTFSDREMAHLFIDNGADMVIGHHAHVIQSHEVYNGKHIFYGLGNFIFPDLNMPSYYNGTEFTGTRYKIQKIQHRRSMVVTIDDKFNVDFYGVVLNGEHIKKSNFKLPTWLPNSEEEFQKKLRMQYKINMLKKFLSEPKIPNLGHFKRFIKLFKR